MFKNGNIGTHWQTPILDPRFRKKRDTDYSKPPRGNAEVQSRAIPFTPSINPLYPICDVQKIKTWFEDPLQLLRCWDCFPNTGMSDEERFNTITRLVIVVAVLLLIVGIGHWWIFLILGIILILILWFTVIPTTLGSANGLCQKTENVEYLRCRRKKRKKRAFKN